MPSPFAETYNSSAAVPFAKNIEPFLLTPFTNETAQVPTKIIRKNKDRKVVPRVIKLPQIVTSKSVSKL
jgi:hypothetical protein